MACVMPALPPPPPSSHPQPSPPPPSPPPPSPPPPPSHLDCAGPVAPLEIAPLVTPVGYEVIPLLRGGKKKRRIGARNFTYVCVHDLDKYTCSECHGSGLCEHKQRRTLCKICGGGSYCKHGRRRYRCADCKCVRGAEGLVPLQDEPQCPICLDLVTVRLCEEGTSATRSTRSIPIDTTCPLKAQCCGTTYHLSCLQANQQHSSVSEAPCPICRSTRLGRQVRLATRENLF
mmetsp:Transcript_103923/g.299227  ORF Transcript_103923/g.299227 Transcript_103923/m.299227 type:complete len:231 (+) Transcript_103923:1327-2019(+)